MNVYNVLNSSKHSLLGKSAMDTINSISIKIFTNGNELYSLLVELIDSASFPRPIEINPKIKHLIEDESLIITYVVFTAWYDSIVLKSRNVILSRPKGEKKKDYQLRTCIASLSPVRRTFLVETMDTTDSNEDNHIFLECIKLS